jgi:drug/metabolite transporter (DMT)-like permease
VSGSGSAAGFGLLSATSWGGSDFVGGIGARRAPALLVVASGHIFSLLLLLALCRGLHVDLPGSAPLVYSALGGFEGALALATFYRALAMGAMGLTAALTGLLTALVPVLFSLVHEGLPTPLTGVGLALGLIAIWLITHTPTPATLKPDGKRENPTETASRATTPPAALLLGGLAGIGFGTQLILFKMASGGGILWIMTSARAAGVLALVIVLAVMPPKAPWRGFWFTGIMAGTLDTVGNLFYIQATRVGRLDVAAIVCSMYPAGTILLAAIVLHEWPTARQFTGIALALAAVALLSV